jgi:lysophospholipase
MSDFIRIKGNPEPPGELYDFSGADGAYLRAGLFPAANARGTVVLMAGRSEFIEKYFEVIGDLQARGLNVASMDWRGQGLSDRLLPVREKGHIADFRSFRADLMRFSEEVAMARLAGPYVLLTHSMGGAPALQILGDGYDKFSCAVLCAPMTRLFDDILKRVAVRVMAATACAFGATRQSVLGTREHSMAFEGNNLTSDPIRHKRFLDLQVAAPNAAIREPTYGWLKAASDAMDDLHRPHRYADLKVPVRIISAGADSVVSHADHFRIAAMSPLIDVVTVEGALHEIMMEKDAYRAAFWKAFDEFVDPILARRNPESG